MLYRSIRWSSLIGGTGLIVLGVWLVIDQAHMLPLIIQRYWPVILIVWGARKLIDRYRVKEDRWAGPDYGTGLYVIRRRRRQSGAWLPGVALIGLGALFLWANFDPALGVTIGPYVLVVLGAIQVMLSFTPPPRSDF